MPADARLVQAKERDGRVRTRLLRSSRKGKADKLYIQFVAGQGPAHEPM